MIGCFPDSFLSKCIPKTGWYLIGTLVLLFTACEAPKEEQELPKTVDLPYQIDLQAAYRAGAEVPLSSFAESITYIALETREDVLIDGYPGFYLMDDYIISVTYSQVYLFDKETGSFLKELKAYGQGPDDFKQALPFMNANEQQQVVYVKDNRNLTLGLDVNGDTRLSFKSPWGAGNWVTNYAQLTDELMVGYQPNYNCKSEVKLVIFNKEGEIMKVFPNHLTCEIPDPNTISLDFGEGAFYRWKNEVGFKEAYNDTLFMVTADSLITKAVFKSGSYGIRYEDKKRVQRVSEDHYFISKLDESENYLFFELAFRGKQFSGYFDKRTGQTQLAKNQSVKHQAFQNDLDDFIPFRLNYATDEGLLVGHMEAPDVLDWMKKHPQKASQLPENLKRISQPGEEDNPIIMLVKLKD